MLGLLEVVLGQKLLGQSHRARLVRVRVRVRVRARVRVRVRNIATRGQKR